MLLQFNLSPLESLACSQIGNVGQGFSDPPLPSLTIRSLYLSKRNLLLRERVYIRDYLFLVARLLLRGISYICLIIKKKKKN